MENNAVLDFDEIEEEHGTNHSFELTPYGVLFSSYQLSITL